jgi:integrase/recombinase XerD
MKIADAITSCIHYHKINSRPNTLANYEFILEKPGQSYQDLNIDAIMAEGIKAFLANITEGRKQNTKRSRFTPLSAFFSLIINTLHPEIYHSSLSAV